MSWLTSILTIAGLGFLVLVWIGMIASVLPLGRAILGPTSPADFVPGAQDTSRSDVRVSTPRRSSDSRISWSPSG